MANPWEEFDSEEQVATEAAVPDAAPWESFNEPEKYHYQQPEDPEADEEIYFEATQETVKAPPGTGLLYSQIENDDLFDAPTTTLEQTGAQFDKMSASMVLLLTAFDAIPADQAADFVAEKNRAFAHAQENQPDYMNRFNKQWSEGGVFGKIGAVLSNPRAIGRQIVTQSPNAVLPIMTTYAGAKTGASLGATTMAVLGQIGPQAAAPEEAVTVPLGAGAGAVVGGTGGAFAGSTIMGTVETLDEILTRDYNVNLQDAESVLNVISDPEKMEVIREKAIMAGVSMGAVDAIFQVFGGGFLKAFKNAGKTGKVAAGTADVVVQSVGETSGEAARQYSAFKDVDWDDAVLEGVISLSQSTGQTAIGATVGQTKKAVEVIIDKDTGEVDFSGFTPEAQELINEQVHPVTGETIAEATARANAIQPTNERSNFNSPERVALREKITNDIYGTGATKKEKKLNIVLGAPGAGKSTVAVNDLKSQGYIEVDADIAKEILPEFENGIGAGAVHEESGMIIEGPGGVLEKALIAGDNIALPVLGRTSSKIDRIIDTAKELGYDVDVTLVSVSPQTSLERNIKRFGQTGRLVPLDFVASVGNAPKETFDKVIQRKDVSNYVEISTEESRGQQGQGEQGQPKQARSQRRPDSRNHEPGLETAKIPPSEVGAAKQTLKDEAGVVEDTTTQTAKARGKKLSDDIKAIDRELNVQEARLNEKTRRGEPTRAIENSIKKLVASRETLDGERKSLFKPDIPEGFDVFIELAKEVKSVKEFVDRVHEIKGVPAGTAQYFSDKYRDESLGFGQGLADAAQKFIKDVSDGVYDAAVKTDLSKKDVTVKGAAIERAAKRTASQRVSAVLKGFKEGIKIAKKDVKAAQEAIIDVIEQSGLTASDRAKFIRSIKNADSIEKAAKNLPKIQGRVLKLLDAQLRRDTLAKIKKAIKASRKSNVLAVDFARQIENIVQDIDTQNRRESTTEDLRKTQQFFENNPDERAPKRVLKKLEILDKKPLEEVSTSELVDILNDIHRLQDQGRKKLELKKTQKKRLKQKRLDELAASVKPIESTPLAERSIGERLSAFDSVKNRFIEFGNSARNVSLALNPMDVFFDMLDNGADYKGAAHNIFKKPIDKAFSKYLDLKEATTRPVKDMADALKMDDRNFERIGVFAAAQQEGGIQKLEATGLTEKQVKAIKLTDNEMKIYTLMREKLDAMFPAINQTMIEVYNKDVEQVSDYFPFMTDFEAMNELEIEDTLGDSLPSVTPQKSTFSKKKDVEKGFSKSRTGGDQVIKLDAMSIFIQHVDNATYLIEMGADIKALGEVAQSPRFGEIAGDMGQRFTVDWIDLMARKGRAANRVRAIDILRVNTGAAILGYKLSSVLIQPTALADGAALVGGDYVARGTHKVASSSQWRQFLKDNMPEIRERVGDDPSYIEMGGKTPIGKAREAGFWALKNLDLLTASSVAAGAYIRAVESKGGKVDLLNVDADAIQEAQLYLRRTQSSAFSKDIPQIISVGKLTGNASLDKLFFQFQSFLLNRWSIIKHDIGTVGIGRGKTKQAVNGAAFLLLAGAAEIGIRRGTKEIINALVAGDDLDPWEETISEEAVRTGFGTVPIVGNIVGSMQYGSNPVPAISLMDNMIKRAQWAAQSKDPDKKLQHSMSAGLLSAGVTFGVPGVLQAEQLVRGALKDDGSKNKKKGF